IINSVSSATTFAQVGAVEALRGPQDAVDAMVAEFHARRDLVVDGLNSLPGITCLRPKGAFYVFPDVSGTGRTGDELAHLLLNEAGVSVLSGTAFGDVGRYHIRLSYANSRTQISRAIEKMRAVLEPVAVGR
ncbi:MAG: aminotransferase class I/II-fold pyridoxal phosphate-dependent enzyme, partial [Chloroflexi bacterium]|nr:aminotransferase class I/II-fold pyridoxal phosphate-dependent enzyme [Chloroflexota bacterium]